MKTNLSKTKITKIVICTLLIATILQVTSISMVQATQESLETATTPPIRPTDDTVVITRDDPNLNATEDLNVVILEDGETVNLIPEPLTRTEDDEIIYVKPADDATIGITEVDIQETYSPLIAPNPQSENGISLMNGALLLVSVGAIAVAFIAVGIKKTK